MRTTRTQEITMSDWYHCPECDAEENIVTIHDTLYICDECETQFNPRQIYG